MHHEGWLLPARAQEAEAGCPPQGSQERRLSMSSAKAVQRLNALPAVLNERDELEGKRAASERSSRVGGKSKPAKSSLSECQGFTFTPGSAGSELSNSRQAGPTYRARPTPAAARYSVWHL